MPELFGAKLRYVRRQLKLTQSELAHYLSLASYTYISRLEANQRTPSLIFIARLAVLFRESTDYFLRDNIPVDQTTFIYPNLAVAENVPMQLLGQKLVTLRTHRGWSQTQLTQLLGLSHPGYVNNLEAGRRLPSLDLVVQIADLFNVTTDYLLSDTIPVESKPT